MTTVLLAPAWSSSVVNVRPCDALTPSVGNRDAVAEESITRLAVPLPVLKLAPLPELKAANEEKDFGLESISSRYSGSEIQFLGIPSFFSAPQILTSCCGCS